MKGAKVLGYLWAAPASLVGLLLAPFFKERRIARGVLLAEGAQWPRKLGWRYRAITFGHVVLAIDPVDEETFRHESVHVSQYERWGPLFFIAYPFASLWANVHGGHHYLDNIFERRARGQ